MGRRGETTEERKGGGAKRRGGAEERRGGAEKRSGGWAGQASTHARNADNSDLLSLALLTRLAAQGTFT